MSAPALPPAVDAGHAPVAPVAGGTATAGPPAGEGDLLEDAPCGYLTCDGDGVVTWANRTLLAWTGHRPTDVVGRELTRLFPVGDRMLWATSSAPQLRTTGSVAEVALEIITASGQRRAVLASATRTTTGHGDAQVRVILVAAHERREHERTLVDALRRAQDSERESAAVQEEMRRLAVTDALTDLPNRRGLGELLDAALEGDDRGRSAVLVIDLDRFKAVNDSLGHAAGDELLVVVAERLRTAVRRGAVARLAGDEFVVLAEAADDDQAAALGQRLLEVLGAPVVVEGLEIQVDASIGVARTREGEGAQQVLHRADVAMYQAKARGHAGVVVHDPTVPDPAADRLRVLGELRAGIERGELVVHYQPRVDLAADRLVGVEALVRWAHPTRGLLLPDAFIDVAEDSGLIHRLGAVVLREALAQGARWAAEGHRVEVAVNLSARQLGDPDLPGAVAAALAEHGLDPALVTLEVTETALMADPDAAAATLEALEALGVTLAVDDFGTGYASLTYLQRFPLDELKIDRSFVSGMTERPADAAIVATCVYLARALGLRTVAEGVESVEQRDALVDLGCDQAQGYWYSRPVPADQVALPPS